MIASIEVRTHGKGLYEITRDVQQAVESSQLADGLCTIFIQHTSASLAIQENADPSAAHDLQAWLDDRVPEDDPLFTHTTEGPDDMPAHVKSALTATTLSVPFADRRLALGTWQGIFVWEHRRSGSNRRCVIHLSK